VDIEPLAIATASNRLGAGRARKGDPIDRTVGIELLATVGTAVDSGARLAVVHARTETQAADALAAVLAAIQIGAAPPMVRPVVIDRYTSAL
jgi:thymidine phosphorylase